MPHPVERVDRGMHRAVSTDDDQPAISEIGQRFDQFGLIGSGGHGHVRTRAQCAQRCFDRGIVGRSSRPIRRHGKALRAWHPTPPDHGIARTADS
ncbi:MAG: hypothetical protein JWP62_1403 [Blastococcus sp.]|jgi:hypothetical protein|nr:hypothetical protein [Blastococcus sp.]